MWQARAEYRELLAHDFKQVEAAILVATGKKKEKVVLFATSGRVGM